MLDLPATIPADRIPSSYQAAKQSLSELVSLMSVGQVKEILNKATAFQCYVEQAKNPELIETAVESRCLAVRALGLKMEEMPKAKNRWDIDSGFSENPLKAPTLGSQGIDKNLANRARKAAKLADDEFDAYVDKEKERVIKLIDSEKGVLGSICTGKNEWYTPAEYVEAAREVMGGIDLDPATCSFAQKTVQAGKFFTAESDGLTKDWKGRIWLNPPYAKPLIDNFVTKLVGEVEADRVEQAILLTHAHTDTGWFHRAVQSCSAICFTKGRVKFYDENGVANSPPEGHSFLYFGRAVDRFTEVFSRFGFVAQPLAFYAGSDA